MKFWRKRGIEKETLVLLILALAILVWYVGFHKTIRSSADHSVDVTACRASVERNARLHIRGFEFPTSVNCPAESLTITDVKTANEKIANSMYDCWYKFGEGKLNLFKDEATFCSVCSFIDVKTDEPVTGLPLYLMDHQIPDKSGRLYYDYLGGFQTEKAKDVLGEMATTRHDVLNSVTQNELTKGGYAAIFVYAKGKDEFQKVVNHMLLRTTAGELGMAFGVGFGATAGGSAMLTLVGIGVGAGPAGWVALAAGLTIWSIAEAATYILSPDNVPEWASFIVLRDWDAKKDPDKTADILKNELGCTYFPAKLE